MPQDRDLLDVLREAAENQDHEVVVKFGCEPPRHVRELLEGPLRARIVVEEGAPIPLMWRREMKETPAKPAKFLTSKITDPERECSREDGCQWDAVCEKDGICWNSERAAMREEERSKKRSAQINGRAALAAMDSGESQPPPAFEQVPVDYWTRARMIERLRELALQGGSVPFSGDFSGPTTRRKPNISKITREFGNWGNFVEAAGFPRPQRGASKVPVEVLPPLPSESAAPEPEPEPEPEVEPVVEEPEVVEPEVVEPKPEQPKQELELAKPITSLSQLDPSVIDAEIMQREAEVRALRKIREGLAELDLLRG